MRKAKVSLTVLATSTLLVALCPMPAKAGSRTFDTFDTCTTINCGATFLNGTPQRNALGDSDPFTIQVYSNGNECLRLDVTSELLGSDLEIVLVSPSGTVWRNDDTNGTRPLVKANTDVDGFYSVQINYYNGLQPINSVQGFTLAYGRYNSGNPNCSGLTTPLATSGVEKAK